MKGILKRSGWNLDIIIHNMIKEKNYQYMQAEQIIWLYC